MTLTDCTQSPLLAAAKLMMADPSGAGRFSLQRIADRGTEVNTVMGSTSTQCAGRSNTGCTTRDGSAMYLNVMRSTDALAGTKTHEARHVPADEGEVAAVNASLDFWDALPDAEKQDESFRRNSAARRRDPKAFNATVAREAQRAGVDP
jgi:hypothetical protein